MYLCPCCDCTEVVPLGKLGRHDYVKCRDCGLEYSTYVEGDEGAEAWDESWEESDDMDHLDRFADAEALASAGFGTDEDYGHFGGDE